MFLRQIQIRGFKSFADKTVLEFIPGVSVIVGPNGSGKSNLVDAISWALGEQGARALRGGQMADVIFAGTPSRPALGMAEVKLVIDNSRRQDRRAHVRDRGQPHDLPLRRERVPDQRAGRTPAGRPGAPVGDPGSAGPSTPWWDRGSWRRCCWLVRRIAASTSRRPPGSRSIGAGRSAPSASSPGSTRISCACRTCLAELRRQLKPLQQQAEMAKKHESLTAAGRGALPQARGRAAAGAAPREGTPPGWMGRGSRGAQGRSGAARQPRRRGVARSRRARRGVPRRWPTPSSAPLDQADRTRCRAGVQVGRRARGHRAGGPGRRVLAHGSPRRRRPRAGERRAAPGRACSPRSSAASASSSRRRPRSGQPRSSAASRGRPAAYG